MTDAEVWRQWARMAPARLLEEFLSRHDAGETELHIEREGMKFLVEVKPLQHDYDEPPESEDDD